jgi:hypothetical protein
MTRPDRPAHSRHRKNPARRAGTVTREQYYRGQRTINIDKPAPLPALALEDMDYPRVDPVAKSNLAWAVFDDL